MSTQDDRSERDIAAAEAADRDATRAISQMSGRASRALMASLRVSPEVAMPGVMDADRKETA